MQWVETKLATAASSQHAQGRSIADVTVALSPAALKQLRLHAAVLLASALTKLGTLDADPASLLSSKLSMATTAAVCFVAFNGSMLPHGPCHEMDDLQGQGDESMGLCSCCVVLAD